MPSLRKLRFQIYKFYTNKSWHLNCWHFHAFALAPLYPQSHEWMSIIFVCKKRKWWIGKAGRGKGSLRGVAVGLIPLLVNLSSGGTPWKCNTSDGITESPSISPSLFFFLIPVASCCFVRDDVGEPANKSGASRKMPLRTNRPRQTETHTRRKTITPTAWKDH